MDNRVRVLIFGKLDLVRLRYLTPGFKFRECAAISYVQLTIGDSGATVDRFKVDLKQMLVFQEDREHLVAWLVMADLPTTIILSLIEQHQYPQLPRLSNQREFGALCPEESSKTRKQLCVVLFARNTEELCEYRQAMRDIVRANRFSPDLVRLTCLLAERQQQFVSSLIKGATEQLVDENAATLFTRIANNIIELSEVRRDNLTKDELIPAARLVLTVTDIIAGGYVVSYLVKSREENVQKQLGLQGPTGFYLGLQGPMGAYRGLQERGRVTKPPDPNVTDKRPLHPLTLLKG